MSLRNQDFSPGGSCPVQGGLSPGLTSTIQNHSPGVTSVVQGLSPGLVSATLCHYPGLTSPRQRLSSGLTYPRQGLSSGLVFAVHPGLYSRVWVIHLLLCLCTCVTPTTGLGLHSLEFQKTVYRAAGGSEPRFLQTTLLDGEVVSQCQSPQLREQPQQQWAELAFSSSEMESRDQACQAQYYEMIQCLQEIEQVLNNTAAVLQRRHGCSLNDTSLFPFEQWGVNGDDFLTFDPQAQTWLPQSKMAAPMTLRWNRHLLRNQIRNHVYSHLSQDGCRAAHSSLHRKRRDWGQEVTSSPPGIDVQVFVKPIPESSETSLQCHVTGSDLSGVRIQLTKDGVPLDRGVELIGPRPNGDGTNQMRVQVLISMTDTGGYQCEVYRESGHHSSATVGVPSVGERIVARTKPAQQQECNVKRVWGVVVCVVAVGAILLNTLLRCNCLNKKKQQCIPTVEEQIKLYLQIVLSNEEYDKWRKIADNFYGKYEEVLRQTRL